MSNKNRTPPHVKGILREKVLVPREWLHHSKEDIGRALLVYGCLVKVYAPFGGGNAVARLKDNEHMLERDGYSRAPLVMRKEVEKTAMDEANHRTLDLVEMDNPINLPGVRVGCPNCGDEYDLGSYDAMAYQWRNN